MERYKTLADYTSTRSTGPRVGGDMETWCTRCRAERTHTILALEEGEPVRVQCNSCRSQHNVRGGGGGPPRAPRRSGPATPGTSRRAPRDWVEASQGKDLRNPIAYDPHRAFAVGEVLIHGRFGVGVVRGLKDGGKMLVTFQDDTRLLVHGR